MVELFRGGDERFECFDQLLLFGGWDLLFGYLYQLCACFGQLLGRVNQLSARYPRDCCGWAQRSR